MTDAEVDELLKGVEVTKDGMINYEGKQTALPLLTLQTLSRCF